MDAISSLRSESGIVAQFAGILHRNKPNYTKLFSATRMSLDLKEQPLASTTLSSSSSSTTKTSSIGISRGMRWLEKSTEHNMFEIQSMDHLVESLLNAGEKLVVLDFYSPACGGCKSLHPKICQLAESNPNVMFLKVNQEELKTMCNGLNVHVLPFFKFYRGSQGKLCSFSCTISTLDKHGNERCSLGPTKGLDDKELTALAYVGELRMNLRDNSTLFQEMLQ
ncbi:unnamed protein product [Cochlearia groenlandica]